MRGAAILAARYTIPVSLLLRGCLIAGVGASALFGCAGLFDLDALERADGGASSDDSATEPSADANSGDAPNTTGGGSTFTQVAFDPPLTSTLYSVWARSATKVFAVGSDGLILESDGDAWSRYQIGEGIDLSSVWGTGSEIYAAGVRRDTKEGVLYQRNDATWAQVAVVPYGLRSVWGIDDARFVIGAEGAVYSGGPGHPMAQGFKELAPAGTTLDLRSVSGSSASSVFIAGGTNAYMTYDGAWHLFADEVNPKRAFVSTWGVRGALFNVFVGANFYGLFQFNDIDGPADASAQLDAPGVDVGDTGLDVTPGGHRKLLLELNEEHNDPEDANRYIWGIWGDAAHIVAVGTAGRLMTWSSTNWTRIFTSPCPGQTLYGVSGTSFDDLWLVGEGGTLLHGRVDI